MTTRTIGLLAAPLLLVAALLDWGTSQRANDVAPGGGGAQCVFWFHCGVTIGDHTATEVNLNADQGPPHTACSTCWNSSGPTVAWPSYCHPGGCTSSEEEEEAMVAIRAAAAIGDVAEVARLSALVPDYVAIDINRRAIQVLDCDRSSVVISLTLTESMDPSELTGDIRRQAASRKRERASHVLASIR